MKNVAKNTKRNSMTKTLNTNMKPINKQLDNHDYIEKCGVEYCLVVLINLAVINPSWTTREVFAAARYDSKFFIVWGHMDALTRREVIEEYRETRTELLAA